MDDKLHQLLEKIAKVCEDLKDFNKFKHIFSDDKAVSTIARLRSDICDIGFLAKASKIKKIKHPEGYPIKEDKGSGSFVTIRPCSSDYGDKTYLGLLIGDAALGSRVVIEDDEIYCSWSGYNPAIFVFDLKKVIYGCESWWGVIESEEDMSKISDADINNIWYVKALKQLTGKED